MRFVKTALLGLIALALGGFLLELLGIFGIHYLHAVENDPFSAAVEVTSIGEDRLELRDGRVLKFPHALDSDVSNAIHENDGRIGLEIDEDGVARLYGRRQRTICGTGMPMIIVPLIPLNVPRYDRLMITSISVEVFTSVAKRSDDTPD
jgi:hypothetical protein